MLHGGIVTNTNLETLDDLVQVGKWSVLKVITGWGLGRTWTDTDRARVLAMTPQTIIRTVAGDPTPDGRHQYLHVDDVLHELEPWYKLAPRRWFELGNEPNLPDRGIDPFGYTWHLANVIPQIRKAFPKARLISPAMSFQVDNAGHWMQIMRDGILACDAIGIHIYDSHGPLYDSTQSKAAYQAVTALTKVKPLWMTECGIHQSSARDLLYGRDAQRFARDPRILGMTWYHLCDDRQVDGVYALQRDNIQVIGRDAPVLPWM